MTESTGLKDKYSIIIPYRNREAHLELLLPRLQEVFKDKEYEIIVSEQNDNDSFNLSNTQNIGAQYATGNIIVLHQVDYYPTEDVSYDIQDQPVLPARRGIFVSNDLTKRDYNDIPTGYRKWEVGTFLCLHHEDNGNIAAKPKEEQEDFILGRQMLANFKTYKHLGYKSVTADIEEFETDIPNVRWIKNTNYKIHENIN